MIVPTWNEAARLPRLLDALAACRPAPLEVIVADGGSTDATTAIARERATLVAALRRRGRQQNAGARAARGEVLWFLHADSLPPRSASAEILAATALGAVGGCFLIAFPPAERALYRLLPVIERGINARTRWTLTGTGDQGIFVRREAFERMAGFPDWPLFEDVELFARLAAIGRPALCRGPLVVSARRWLAGGPVRTTVLMWTLRIAYMAGVPPAQLARRWREAPGP